MGELRARERLIAREIARDDAFEGADRDVFPGVTITTKCVPIRTRCAERRMGWARAARHVNGPRRGYAAPRKAALARRRPRGPAVVMTGDNKRKNIAIEVARGEEALRESEQLLGASLPTGAVSRAYVAAVHFSPAA